MSSADSGAAVVPNGKKTAIIVGLTQSSIFVETAVLEKGIDDRSTEKRSGPMGIHRFTWLAGLLAFASGVPIVFVGCGDDSGATTQQDASSDVGVVDSTLDQTTTDVAPDKTTADVAPDQGTGTDAMVDASDAGSSCALFDASALDGATVATGLNLVASVYRCWGCHQNGPPDAGITLEGRDTTLRDGAAIFPPNLTPDMTGLGCWTNDQIASAILNGTLPDGGGMCVMPKFGLITNDAGTEPMDAATAGQIVEFLRSLHPVAHTVSTTVCPAPAGDGGGSDASDASTDAAADGGEGGDAGAGDAADGE
jgi:hypothetical protein